MSWQQEAQSLFDPECPLSGDPNPANWGMRDDSSLVLFDWERYCLGTPALDLAITVPGLGDLANLRRVAAAYLHGEESQAPRTPERLAREIALAKVWSVVEFLARNSINDGRTAATIRWLQREFSRWFGELAAGSPDA